MLPQLAANATAQHLIQLYIARGHPADARRRFVKGKKNFRERRGAALCVCHALYLRVLSFFHEPQAGEWCADHSMKTFLVLR